MKSRIFLAVFVLCLSCFTAGVVSAQGQALPDHPACEQNFYDVLKARAWMEAQREVEVAETLILKPDSVLEYSCFTRRLDELGRAADTMFSDNVTNATGVELFQQPPTIYNRNHFISQDAPEVSDIELEEGRGLRGLGQTRVEFGPQPPGGLDGSGLDTALESLVKTSLNEFVGRNFGHALAGGTFDGSTLSAGGQPCSAMNAIWPFLKCQNINKINFFRFQELLLSDPRTQPMSCNDADRGNLWAVNIAAADPPPNGLGGVESMEPHLHLDLFDVSKDCSASSPVSTGVLAHPFPPAGQEPHPDAICITPGCYYDGRGACTSQ